MPLLRDYLDGPHPPIRWRNLGGDRFSLASQVWRGLEWQHDVWRTGDGPANWACLLLTGDLVPGTDGPYLDRLASATGMKTYGCFGLPNQPLFGGLREDDLVAHTFAQYLQTGERDWPLLLPMVRAGIAAIEAVQEIDPDVERFLITGGSKRGWTTWLLGTLRDPRIAGIAPQVFDNLNIAAQMRQQARVFGGGYSPKLEDYTRRALQAMVESPAGAALAAELDPFTFRDALAGLPKLLIHGTNDAFWLPDSMSRYADLLPGPTATCFVPNTGHNLGDGNWCFAALGAFARSLMTGMPLPDWRSAPTQTTWSAHVPQRHEYVDAVWRPQPGGNLELTVGEFPGPFFLSGWPNWRD